MIKTMTRSDLMALGYGPSFSRDIIRQAKYLMIEKGFGFYKTKKLGRVPVEAVEEILGIKFSQEELRLLRTTDGTTLIKKGNLND
ncbi:MULTISPECIES: DUF3173 domain-containing protein [unclassified Enterococcus]|uniref:DUF3173 domain-containing protein n=1 Tax=Enterococcus thailandicus TaxID=417368 RepID=UPI001C13066E|nr:MULTISPECIES: DUF3173 domain-containing protein [unclassified Enterococcus]